MSASRLIRLAILNLRHNYAACSKLQPTENAAHTTSFTTYEAEMK